MRSIQLIWFVAMICVFSCTRKEDADVRADGEGDPKTEQETHSIDLFENINGIDPGTTDLAKARELLGAPETTQKLGATDDFQLLSFKGGIHVIAKRAPNSKIDAVYVEDPFKGESSEGISLGMPREAAIAILDKKFYMVTDLGDSRYYAVKTGGDSDLQVVFTGGELSRIKLYK